MRFRPMLLLLLSLPAYLAGGQNLNDLQAAEKARFQAILSSDVEDLADRVAEDLVYTHSNCTVETKKEYLDAFRSGKYRFTQFETDSTRYRRLNRRTVVGTGIARMSGNVYETPFQLRSRYTAIYVRQKGRWRLHTWQTTRCLN